MFVNTLFEQFGQKCCYRNDWPVGMSSNLIYSFNTGFKGFMNCGQTSLDEIILPPPCYMNN